jgi:hypothetical protein
MNWLNEEYLKEHREQEVRELMRDAEIREALEESKPKIKSRRIRQAVGGKLIALGERLQEPAAQPHPARASKA